MPRIEIDEIDVTSGGTALNDDFVVLVPGRAITGVAESGETLLTKSFVIAEDDVDVTHRIAWRLVNLGLIVLYVVIETESQLDNYTFWQKFTDKGTYNIRFITTGNYASASSAECAIKCAAERGDAVALFDVPCNETVELTLPLVSIATEVDGDIVNAAGTQFITDNLKVLGTFEVGDVQEVAELTSGNTFTFVPEQPETTAGTYTVIVTATHEDADHVVYKAPGLAVEYTVEE